LVELDLSVHDGVVEHVGEVLGVADEVAVQQVVVVGDLALKIVVALESGRGLTFLPELSLLPQLPLNSSSSCLQTKEGSE